MVIFLKIHNRMPYGSAAATILCFSALVLDFYFSMKIIMTNKNFESDILHGRSDDSIDEDLYVTEVTLAALTCITAVFILVSGVVGSSESDGLTKKILGNKFTYLVLLICTFSLLISWIFLNLCRAVLLGVYVTNVNNCDSIKNHDGCIAITFNWGADEKTFCGDDLKKCCDDYVNLIYLLYFGSVLSNQMILFSLVIYICCLGMNYKMSQWQEKTEFSESYSRRY